MTAEVDFGATGGQQGEEKSVQPLEVQRMERALSLNPLLSYLENLTQPQQSDIETSTDGDTDVELDFDQKPKIDGEGNKVYNGIITPKSEWRGDKGRLYNFSKVKKSRKWLKNILLSDSSSDEEDGPLTNDDLKVMLRMHKYQKRCQSQYNKDRELKQYQFYSTGLLSNYDKFYDHQKIILGPKRKLAREQKKLEKKIMKAQLKKLKSKDLLGSSSYVRPEMLPLASGRSAKIKKLTPEQIAMKRRKLWVAIAKKEIPRAWKQKASARKEMMSSLKKVAKDCQKECRRAANLSMRTTREAQTRSRRLAKEMMVYWKRFEKVEKEHRRRAEKEAQEQRKMDLELMEMKRQQRKLNFLITQTELYAHFMARKLTGDTSEKKMNSILDRLTEGGSKSQKQVELSGCVVTDTNMDDYNAADMKDLALKNAKSAMDALETKKKAFDSSILAKGASSLFANPSTGSGADHPQPKMFMGKLKGYQMKGMNWLINLYNQGINGILADEMGLGKTVQSIAFLAHLAEAQGLWGPFLVVAPASTLHNWQQEVSRFVPKFTVVPYWGNTQDRKILRKFWNQEHLHNQESTFHVVITSYQLVIQDVKYFQRIKWHYMVLDEAQAIKSTSSVRWKILLGFNCRNRLLLSGTPIQNSMAELWALLHFIMPTLFDSHDEFNEWFSKDIESHAEKQSGIDEDQLSRLHMILKPFMLRRVKKDVENELSDKIEILTYCPLTTRQRLLYQAIKNKISIEDLVQSTSANTTSAQYSTSSLMNLVMQFRKVCNHPELFERREVRAPAYFKLNSYALPKLVYRDAILDSAIPSKDHFVFNKFYIHSPANIHRSLFPEDQDVKVVDSAFSFTRFIDLSPEDLFRVYFKGLLFRWVHLFDSVKQSLGIHHDATWREEDELRPRSTRRLLLLEPERPLSPADRWSSSGHLRNFVFTSYHSPTYTHTTHTLHYTPETISHRKIRLRHRSGALALRTPPPPAAAPLSSPTRGLTSPPLSPTKTKSGKLVSPSSKKSAAAAAAAAEAQRREDEVFMAFAHPHMARPPRSFHLQPTLLPSFIYHNTPKLVSPPLEWWCDDRSAAWEHMKAKLCGTLEARKSLLYGSPEIAERVRFARYYFFPQEAQGLLGLQPKYGYSGVFVPDKEILVTDAGKLYVLDTLLGRLKSEGHRVLIYSQMTRMIDILEEYMWHRKHTYMRLDGSSKISDRRDMVADFQTRSDIFVFLLSTRAGGLGINLTAADTVIFYDSDWNPTVDQQAMDRAHRLGQTKQVTVYRLICKGTIEERILERAREKSEIQRMVISGGSFRPDVLKPKEVVTLLLDDDEMERKLRQKQNEKKAKGEKNKEKDRKRKREKYAAEKQGKPHSGRGPGRPRKVRPEENNLTIPAPSNFSQDSESHLSMDSFSAAASPQSVMSTGSGMGPGDDSSNDGLVIVDDSHTTFPPITPSSTPPPTKAAKRGPGRPRGRPRGSGVGRRPRGRGSVRKAIAAAELAAAEAGKSAAFAAYGYAYTGGNSGSPSPTPSVRGGHSGRGRMGFYTQRGDSG